MLVPNLPPSEAAQHADGAMPRLRKQAMPKVKQPFARLPVRSTGAELEPGVAGDLEIAVTGEKMIPTKHVAFCKEVAKLAAKCGLNSLGMTFKPGYGDGWNDPIQMAWERGRHGEDGKRVVITSTVMVRIEA